MGAYSFKPGGLYAEFRAGDKIAKYGLTALVAGGVGAVDAAVKMVLYYLHERVWYRFIGLGLTAAESSLSPAEAE